MDLELLKSKVRPVTEEDKKNKLPTFSYSKIGVFKQCPYRYNLQYNEKKFSNDTSLAMELGTVCHYVLELKGKCKLNNIDIDYNHLYNVLENGCEEGGKTSNDRIVGTNALKNKYWEYWYEADNASAMTYEDKMMIFKNVLHKEMEDDEWEPVYFEKPFEFVYDDSYILHGFIDRIDRNVNTGEYRTVDYKTSKRVFQPSDLPTAMQFGIYALAMVCELGVAPVDNIYRFILIGEEQHALTKGWEKRLIKALDNVFSHEKELTKTKEYRPKPSPLCYYCNFCRNNPNAEKYKDDCEYFSLWQPTEKTFSVNKEWDPEEAKKPQIKRKLIF